jgi:MFS family permease
MLTIAALVPVSMTTQPEPHRLGAARLRFTHLLKTSQVAFMTCIAMGLASGAFWTLAPVFAKARGLVTDEVAAFIAITILGGGLSQWPLGRLSDYMDRRYVILGCAVASVIAGLLLAFSDVGGVSKLMLFSGAFLFGAASFPIGSLANALMNDNAPRHEMTEVAGGVLLVYGASAIVGPIAAALIIGAIDYSALFFFTAAVHAALALVVVVRLFLRAPVPPHERGHFEAQPQANAGLLAPAEVASNS